MKWLVAFGWLVATMMAAAGARAEGELAAITVHGDGGERPLVPALERFFTHGEPLAYVDWICLGTDGDAGAVLDVELARISVLGDDGRSLGNLTSRSGARHRFLPFHGNGSYRYCTRVLPRGWGDDSVRFVTTRDASHATRVVFGLDGDSHGCRGTRACGELAPRFTGFSYGAAAARFTYVSVGFWRGAEVENGALEGGVTRFRVAAFVPLLYITAGSPTSVRLSAQAGVALPITVASTELRDGGSALGAGIGAYWAQCLELRTPVAPNLCVGAEIDGAVEGAQRGGALHDVRPRAIFSGYVAVGFGR